MHHLRKTLLASLFAALATSASAESNWYQVEMIVFAHQDETSEAEENWPDDVVLNYPSRVKMLFDAIALPNAIDSDFNTTLEVEVPNLLELPAQPSGDDSTLLLDPNSAALATTPMELLDQPLEQPPAPLPLPFQRLDDSAKQLLGALQHLRRIDRYRPLFHEVWQQPLESRRRSPAILITGGDEYGSHFELEGTIKVSVERYLHIDTDLWLHSFLPNFGQQATFQVPELPSRGGTDLTNADTYSPFSFIVNEPYSVSRTVTLRQSRRMRSGEIHYLDHPLFGVIVLVTPLERG